MDVLDAGDQLICEKKDGLEGELPVAEVKQIFEGRTQEIDDHRVIVAFGTEPAHKGDANTTGECLVNFGFILKLRMLGLHGL